MRMSKISSNLTLIAAAIVCVACVAENGGHGESRDLPVGELEAPTGEIALTVASDRHVAGNYVLADEALTFEAKLLEGGAYDIVIELNGMTLTALGEAKTNYHDMDGYASANGQDTDLVEADRELLTSFFRAYQEFVAAPEPTELETQLKNVAGYWSSVTDGMALQRSVMSKSEREINHLCAQYLSWVPTTHDCSHGNDWGGGQWAYSSIGERWDRGPGGFFEHHYYTDSPRWDNQPQVHKGGSYLAGTCLGRCWAACDAPGVNQRLTQDCADHDQCATGNHGRSSIWCHDEAADASDDGLAATALCPGTGSDPQWIVDWETNGYPFQAP